MAVTLISPACWRLPGHLAPEIEGIVAGLAGHGVTCRVLVNRQFPARPGWEGVFRRTTSVPWSSELAWHAGCATANLSFVEDILAWRRGFPTRDDVLVVPTTSINMLLGLLSWLEHRGRNGWPGRLGLHFHAPPELEGAGAALSVALHEHAFERLRRLREAGLAVGVTADNRRLATRLRLLGAPAIVAARPPAVLSEVVPVERRQGSTVLLFIGLPRRDKGFRLVVEALEPLLDLAPDIHVRFVLPSLEDAEAERIRRLEGERVSLRVDGALANEEFHREIAQASLVLCAYDPVAYRLRDSKILLEALAYGVPVIFTAGMASEDEFLELGGIGAVAVPAFHVGALVRSVARARDDLARLTAEARSLAPSWRDRLCRTPWLALHTGIGSG